MTRQNTVILASTLGVVVVLGSGINFILSLDRPQALGNPFAIGDQLLTGLYTMAFGIVGALILARQPRNKIGWLLMTMGLSLSMGGAIQEYLGRHMRAASNLDWAGYIYVWMNAWTWWLLIGPLLLILLVFPTGHLLSPRWRGVAGMVGFLFLFFVTFATAQPVWTSPDTEQNFPNPLGQIPLDLSFDVIMVPWLVLLLTTAALCVLSVVLRYRRSGSVEREQLKWFFYACAIFLVVYVFGVTQSEIPDLFAVLFGLAILFIPVSIGIAILRYHLYEIDVIIRRTLIYGALSIALALVYFGGIVLSQALLRAVAGQTSDLSIVASTLAIAALFTPLRRWIQNLVDRRLYRRKYDAALVLANFGTTVRDEVDLDRLKAQLLTVVDETMRPATANLWLKGAKEQESAQ